MAIRILIVDDHTILRQGVARAIEQEAHMELVGQASNGHTGVELARTLTPDVVIMDIRMPDLNGVEATRLVRRESPQSRIVVLSMHSAKRYVREVFKAGASAYLLKDCEFDELLEAIRRVARGQTYIAPDLRAPLLESCIESEQEGQEDAFSLLTSREREVLQLIAEGNSTKQAARRLHISPKTVEAHRLRIMQKVDVDNIAQLTKYAIQEGLTSMQL